MSKLKRDEVKYIRDRAKSRYPKGTTCEICGTDENLDFHHYYTLSVLWNNWRRKLPATLSVSEIEIARDEFIAEHEDEVINLGVTICNAHHTRLHEIYGKNPALGTAKKQMRWVQIQREKHELPELDTK